MLLQSTGYILELFGKSGTMKNFFLKMFKSVLFGANYQFYIGICLGVTMTLILHMYEGVRRTPHLTIDDSLFNMERVLSRPGFFDDGHSKKDLDEILHNDLEKHSDTKQRHFEDSEHHHDDSTLADELYKKVRVACWILTSPSNLDKKAIHVKNTWAKRCNLVLFMSSVHNASFPTVGLNVTEGRSHLTAKSMKAFKYLYDNHMDDADWFLKADDDTYVILENLRYFLSDEDPKNPVYFGHRFKTFIQQGYTSGGGGYVLSKEALRRFGTEGSSNSKLCRPDLGSEDVEMGKCLQNLGVKLKPSLDSMKRTRFHCFSAETMVRGRYPKWYYRFDTEGVKWGIGNISDYAISFHYISPWKMYDLEFYTYHLRPYGIINQPQNLNLKT